MEPDDQKRGRNHQPLISEFSPYQPRLLCRKGALQPPRLAAPFPLPKPAYKFCSQGLTVFPWYVQMPKSGILIGPAWVRVCPDS